MIINYIVMFIALFMLFVGFYYNFKISIWLIITSVCTLYLGYFLKITTSDPIFVVTKTIQNSFSSIAYTIMVLFGYNHYMQTIKANNAMINLFIKPFIDFKYPYILLMIFFVLTALISTIITSASALAILLINPFYIILHTLGVSAASVAAITVSGAGILPSPLAVETHMSSSILNLDIHEYISKSYYLTLTALVIMTITHGFWQWFCDKKEQNNTVNKHDSTINIKQKNNYFLAILPLLPLLLFFLYHLFSKNTYDIVSIIFISIIISCIVDTLQHKDIKKAITSLTEIWHGMAKGLIQVGSIVISAGLFIQSIKEIGIMTILTHHALHLQSQPILLLIVLMIAIILTGVTSGSGLALYFSLVPLIPEFSTILQISGWKLSTLLEVTAHMSRNFSTISAVMIVTSKQLNLPIIKIIKRTTLPITTAIITLMIQIV